MKNKKKPVYLPLTHALAWIVGSTLLFSGGSYSAIKRYVKNRHQNVSDPQFAIRSIIQTGPQKEALKTEYLAELLGISSDRPVSAKFFSLSRAKERLLNSPLISHADVKLIKPGTLYIDYTIRQPIAWMEDYENVVLDKEGFLFPFSPFFSPKHLPSIYLGLAPFGMPAIDPERPTAQWGTALQGKYIELALSVLNIVTDSKVADLFSVRRIDVSNAFAESYGTREIVVITEDFMVKHIDGKDVQLCLPRILRLSTKNYTQELGNYLKLREQILEEERKISSLPEGSGSVVRLKEKIIDFRIQKLAFIEEQKNKANSKL
ncbi:MAG: hypothetical protein JSS60_01240 [Verrucomicrobia bacterium]|nr:hypothetical protein [Verrucomicrobiota bacterium]